MPPISVLIPCYNVAQTVDEALASLEAQSLQDFEVVLVDDGSTDATRTRLEEWSSRDHRMRVLPLPHQGIIPALNAGLEACQSAYIARMDADDRSIPHRLERQVEMLATHPEVAAVSSLVRGFPPGSLGREFAAYIDWLNTLLTDEDIKRAMFLHSPLAHPSVAYRREWLQQLGGYQDHGWAEDYDLWLRMYLAGANFNKIPEVLLEWRDHPRRLTHTDGRYSKNSDLLLKAHYLARGPLSSIGEVVIWGTAPHATQLGELLLQRGCPLSGYVADQPLAQEQQGQLASTIHPGEFYKKLHSTSPPAILVAENDPAKRAHIVQQLETATLHQGVDWWEVG